MSTRIPPLLEPFLSLSTEPSSSSPSLHLITSILGASANWLLLRYLLTYLKPSSASSLAHTQRSAENAELGDGEGNKDVGVVLVSFLRDGAFWRECAGKLGLDLEHAAKTGRFVFLDGLTGLFTPEGAIPHAPEGHTGFSTGKLIRRPALSDIKQEVDAALPGLKPSRKVLVIDGLDAVMAAAGEAHQMSSLAVQEMLFSLRELADTTVLTVSADHPLVYAQTTSLEKEHANLVLSMAHVADRTLALRMLDTGTARDVSGVVRISEEGRQEGKEFLYHVQGDGGVRVFERGS